MDHKNIQHPFGSDLKICYFIYIVLFMHYLQKFLYTIFCYNNDATLGSGIDEFFPKNMFVSWDKSISQRMYYSTCYYHRDNNNVNDNDHHHRHWIL